MPTNEVKIQVTADTSKAQAGLKQTSQTLREMGEKITQVGSRMTMGITAPVVGGLYSVVQAGKAASEQIAKMGVGNVSKDVLKLGQAYDKLQVALKPIKSVFTELASKLLPVITKLVIGLSPTILKLGDFVIKLVDGFNKLSPGMKDFIFILGGIIVAAGPLIATVGTLISTIGTLGSLAATIGPAIAGIGGAATVAAGPIALLVLGIGALAAMITAHFDDIQKFIAILAYAVTGKLPEWAWNIGKAKNPIESAVKAFGGKGTVTGGVPTAPGPGGEAAEEGPGYDTRTFTDTAPLANVGYLSGQSALSELKALQLENSATAFRIERYTGQIPAMIALMSGANYMPGVADLTRARDIGAPGGGGYGTANVTVNVTVNSAVNLANQQLAEQVIAPYIERTMHNLGYGRRFAETMR